MNKKNSFSVAKKLAIVRCADRHGNEYAMGKYGVSFWQVAAYKAHRTMGTYS